MSALTVSMGLLAGARVVDSPNCDARPGKLEPELIVVHGISLPPGRYGGPWIDALFTNLLPAGEDPYFETIQHLRVSSHVLIARDGSLWWGVGTHPNIITASLRAVLSALARQPR